MPGAAARPRRVKIGLHHRDVVPLRVPFCPEARLTSEPCVQSDHGARNDPSVQVLSGRRWSLTASSWRRTAVAARGFLTEAPPPSSCRPREPRPACLSLSILSATTCAPRGDQPADPSAAWPRYGRRRGVRRARRKLHQTTHVPTFRSRRCVRHRNELHRWHRTKTRMGAAKQRPQSLTIPVARQMKAAREVPMGCHGPLGTARRRSRIPVCRARTTTSLLCRPYGPKLQRH